MKKAMFILTAMLMMAVSANAKGITGKWKCSKEFIEGFGLYYDEMKGHYKFKKNGTFTLKINGLKRTRAYSETGWGPKADITHANHRQIYIKVKGTYKIVNDSITTTVRPEDVKCHIQPGRDYPEAPDVNDSRWAIAMKNFEQHMYDQELVWNEALEQTVKNELMHVWTWDKEPVVITKKTLSIGDKATFKRK